MMTTTNSPVDAGAAATAAAGPPGSARDDLLTPLFNDLVRDRIRELGERDGTRVQRDLDLRRNAAGE